jgi:hypothetical protein
VKANQQRSLVTLVASLGRDLTGMSLQLTGIDVNHQTDV